AIEICCNGEKFFIGCAPEFALAWYASSDDSVYLPGFLRFDAGLYAQITGTWKAQLNIENMFNKGYWASADVRFSSSSRISSSIAWVVDVFFLMNIRIQIITPSEARNAITQRTASGPVLSSNNLPVLSGQKSQIHPTPPMALRDA